MNMSFRAFVVASLLLTSLSDRVCGQSPRFTLDLGEGNEKVSANAYSTRNKPYFSAVGSFRVGEFHGVGVQVIGTQTRVGNGELRTEATCPIDFASNTPSATLCSSPLELSGNRSSIGLGVERALFPLLSIRAGASIGWFDAQTSVGSGARASHYLPKRSFHSRRISQRLRRSKRCTSAILVGPTSPPERTGTACGFIERSWCAALRLRAAWVR
jgi:hypothetical protein